MAKRLLILLTTGLSVCVIIYCILNKTMMRRFVFKPYKSVGDGQPQLPVLQTTTHRLATKGQAVKPTDIVLVGSFKNTSTNHAEMNLAREGDKVSELRQEMSCRLKKNVPFSTITRKQAPKDKNKDILPEESLEKLVHFNSCAVVSSSHALRLRTYGQEIDSHDAVLRFNCAPTQKFEDYVGNRTDIRLINTRIPQVDCKEEFWSKNSTMFTNGMLVVRNMDGITLGPRGIDDKKDMFHAFSNLIKYRKTYPNRTLPFIQRPDFGKGISSELAWFCRSTGLCNRTKLSPSSGMFGVVMMMHLCDWVRVYELVPSNRDDTKLKYYYDETKNQSRHDQHSYDQERTYVKTLSLTTEKDVEDTGVVLLRGLSQICC